MFFFSDVQQFAAALIILVCVYSFVTTNRRFFSEVAMPIVLICLGISVGISIADAPPLTGIACVIVLVAVAFIPWTKLIGGVASLFLRVFQR